MIALDHGAASRTPALAAPPDLAPWVEHGWRDAEPRSGPWRLVPDASPHVILVRDVRAPRVMLVGARSTYEDIDLIGRALTIGVRLWPGALPALFGVDGEALRDRAVPLEEVCAAPEVRAALDRPSLPALYAVLRARDARPIDRRLRREGDAVPSRTLRRVVRQQVGLGVQERARIRRLHLAIGARQRGGAWAAIAADAGYCDQAHLAREFRALLGEPPSAFMKRGRSIQDPRPAAW